MVVAAAVAAVHPLVQWLRVLLLARVQLGQVLHLQQRQLGHLPPLLQLQCLALLLLQQRARLAAVLLVGPALRWLQQQHSPRPFLLQGRCQAARRGRHRSSREAEEVGGVVEAAEGEGGAEQLSWWFVDV